MPTPIENIKAFLAQKRIAVAGVSSRSKSEVGNVIYRKLRDTGYEVFPINPHAESVEGVTCYRNLKELPVPVDGVMIVTPPEAAEQIVRACADAGIRRVWMHRSFGSGSVSEAAVRFCHDHGIAVISGGCPMMFCRPVDPAHKCMSWILRLTGGIRS